MTTDFISGLNTYYSLKSQYEDKNFKEKKKIMNNTNLSWKEKRMEFKKLKPKCINCKRSGGTLFTIEYDETEDGRIAKAICGHREDPCPLNIFINLGMTMDINNYLKTEEAEIAQLKNNIIKDKNKLLFGYITAEAAVENFEAVKDTLSQITTSYELFLEKYLLQTNSIEKNDLLKKTRLDIFADISLIKESIKQFERSSDIQFVTDAVTLYIEQLQPKLKTRQDLMYPYNSVFCANNICTLVQKKITIEQMEENFSVNPVGIKSLVVGMIKSKKSKREQTEAEFLQ